jgi:outer membrane cobalamin receptor
MEPKKLKHITREFHDRSEGESTVEDIDLETIGRIEIIKGPNSSLVLD